MFGEKSVSVVAALTLQSKANSVNQGGTLQVSPGLEAPAQPATAYSASQRRQRRPPSLRRRQSRRRHRGPAGDGFNKNSVENLILGYTSKY
jgi:hypothetical protein